MATTFIKTTRLIPYFALIIFTLASCKKEPLIMTASKNYPNVQTELWMYFQRFEQAAADRGINLDLINHGIHGKIESVHLTQMIGMCYHNPDTPKQIIIDKTFWERASTLRKEMIVFHELGHCYLGLDHQNEAHQDGRCKSIMRSGSGTCLDVYTYNNREAYLDELFD